MTLMQTLMQKQWAAAWRLTPLSLGALLALSSCGVVKIVKPVGSGGFANLGFEEGTAGEQPDSWIESSDELVIDDKVKHSGRSSARLENLGTAPEAQANYCADGRNYSNSVVRVSGFMKVKSGIGTVRVSGGGLEGQVTPITINPVEGATETSEPSKPNEWTQWDLVTSFGRDTRRACIQLSMTGKGTAWFDDLLVEKVDLHKLRPKQIRKMTAPGLDMETSDPGGYPSGWNPGVTSDPEVKHAGSFSARSDAINIIKNRPQYCGRFSNPRSKFTVDPLRGAVIRISGWMKADPPDSEMWLGFIAFGPEEEGGLPRLAEAHRFFRGSDWTRRELITSVPKDLGDACILWSSRDGYRSLFGEEIKSPEARSIWADDFNVEILDL